MASPITKATRFERAKRLVNDYGTDWATAFLLAAGGRTRAGDDYDQYVIWQENLSESPYMLGRPSAAFGEC